MAKTGVNDFSKLTAIILEVVNSKELRRTILSRAVLELADRLRVYPPAGQWNAMPGTRGDMRWYQRLFGPRYMRKNGSLGGKNTSQQLQRSWKVEVMSRDEFTASVFTEVTYAPYLYDPKKRVSWAAEHGWKTTDEISDDYIERFLELAADEVEKKLSGN